MGSVPQTWNCSGWKASTLSDLIMPWPVGIGLVSVPVSACWIWFADLALPPSTWPAWCVETLGTRTPLTTMPGYGLPSAFFDVGWVTRHLQVIELGEPTLGHGDNVVDLKISPHVAFSASSGTGNKTGCICMFFENSVPNVSIRSQVAISNFN